MAYNGGGDVEPLLGEGDRLELQGKGKLLNRSRGFLLFAEGELTTETFLIEKGHVKVTSGGPDQIVAIRGPGEVVGEMSAFDNGPRSASVYAMDDISFLLITREQWLAFLDGHPHIYRALIRSLNARLREATAKQTQVSWFGVEQRLAKGLLELAGKVGQADEGDIVIHGMSQRELAGLVGASRESVSQVMRAFRAEGLVSTGRERLVIHDRARLREVADRLATTL